MKRKIKEKLCNSVVVIKVNGKTNVFKDYFHMTEKEERCRGEKPVFHENSSNADKKLYKFLFTNSK